jgi:riboflavin synthase alpha subunit
MNPEEQLQARLSRLENGESFETCAADLPAAEVELLKVVTALQSMAHPAQSAESIAAQRAALLTAAAEQRGTPLVWARAPLFPPGRWSLLMTWIKRPRVAALAAAIAVIVIGLLLLRPAAPVPATNPAASAVQNVPLKPIAQPYTQFIPSVSSAELAAAAPGSAVVAEVRGIVELQTDAGQWRSVSNGQALSAGQQLRTRDLSGAALRFYDGSQTQLGPATEVVIEELNAPTSGPRTILLTQLSGSTDHQVAHSGDPASRYEVHTPNGDSLARGTRFHVSVSPALVTRVDVAEGIVAVINADVTVQVTAGQVTTISPGAPPAPPSFYVSGEGVVTQMGEVWRIGGLDFRTTNATVIVGNPQLGDRVAVNGHLAPDGTRLADVIVLLSRALQNRFEFSGPVETIGSDQWTIAGRTVAVSPTTQIDDGLKVGDLVKTDGVIRPDGTLLAENIRLLTEPGLPFEFTGLVQQMGSTAWTVSGISLAVTATTEIEAGLQVGDLVKVEGHILPNGTWLADEIKRAPEFENRFEFTGIVQHMAPWTVSGITFTTTEQTEIDAGIEIGDRVKVEGRILADGAWLAEEIRLLDEEPLAFEFIGQVTHIDPWIVSGITFTVNSSTTIESGIVVGDRVRVTGIVQPDGSLLAQRIELLDEELGCIEIRVKIVAINGQQLVLSDGQTIELTDEIEIEGQLKVSAVVIIRLCVRADGTIVVVSIVVIFIPAPPPPPPPPSGSGQVTICHYPGGDKNKGHTLSVGQAAVSAHLAHGDRLGPCNSGHDDDDDHD